MRDHHEHPATRSVSSTEVCDPYADAYRVTCLGSRTETDLEYLVWAANSSDLARVDDPSWRVSEGSGVIPSTELGGRVFVFDDEGRDIGQVLFLVVSKGDVEHDDGGWFNPRDPSAGRKGLNPYWVITPTIKTSRIVVLSSSTVTQRGLPKDLEGGLGLERGDSIVEAHYTLQDQTFWWTRNDRYQTRFGWDGAKGRWTPRKGSTPQNLGLISQEHTTFKIPVQRALPQGSILEGDASNTDAYAVFRVGPSAGVQSLPLGVNDTQGFTGVQVVSDSEVDAFDFTSSTLSAVLGQFTGVLKLNLSFASSHTAKTLWWVTRDFSESSTGLLGSVLSLKSDPLFLAPIPNSTDRPILRIGNNSPLSVTLYETEALLPEDVEEGSCGVALSTGRLVLSSLDIAKSDPDDPRFVTHRLGANVFYGGVSLNQKPQPFRLPTNLLQGDGVTTTIHPSSHMLLPKATVFPEDGGQGLGTSGVLFSPDNTGKRPSTLEAGVRSGGDVFGVQGEGLVRQIESLGEAFLFTREGSLGSLVVVDRIQDLPETSFDVPQGQVWVSRESVEVGGVDYSPVQIGFVDRTRFSGLDVYFRQAVFTPSVYVDTPSITSQTRRVFRFEEGDILYFSIDGTDHEWEADGLGSTGPFTAQEVALSIQDSITDQGGTGVCKTSQGAVVLITEIVGGSVEIGSGDPEDFSGCIALGFLPGHRVVEGGGVWLWDSGLSFGSQRTSGSDFKATARVEDLVLSDSVSPSPVVFLDYPPLEDEVGYDEGVFFNIQSSIFDGESLQVLDQRLEHFDDIEHRFGEGTFAWLESQRTVKVLETETLSLPLGASGVVPDSLHPALGGGLFVSDSTGGFSLQKLGEDYLLPNEGLPGIATLIEVVGQRTAFGGAGKVLSGVFTDANETPSVTEGGILRLGDSYVRFSGENREVQASFEEDSTEWEIFNGTSQDQFDDAIVGDMVYGKFSHLPFEVFGVLVLSPLTVTDDAHTYTANLAKSLSSGRKIHLSVEPVQNPTSLVLTPLGVSEVGSLTTNLILPSSSFISEGVFSLRVGATTIKPTPVTSYSLSVVGAEYLTQAYTEDGVTYPENTVRFGAQILTDYEGSTVFFLEEFYEPTQGTAFYDPLTGVVRVPQGTGTHIYLVEEMVLDSGDVRMSPLDGGLSFTDPIQKGSLVQVSYWQADVEGRRSGDQVVEFLPVFIRQESLTRRSTKVFLLDADDTHEIDKRFTPLVYLGAEQQNFTRDDFVLSEEVGVGWVVTFNRDLPDYVTPTANYAVFDCVGGERSFNVSSAPVYRPPFFLKKGKDTFGLRTDRTADFIVGALLRLSNETFYITGSRYSENQDATQITFFPKTSVEVGSRSPSQDSLCLLTKEAVTPSLFPDSSEVVTQARKGFMFTVPFSFEPVVANQTAITFLGDLTQYAQTGHILEISGRPYTIATSELSPEGVRTKITLTSSFQDAVDPLSSPTVRLTVRPVYGPDTAVFTPKGPLVETESVSLVLFGASGVGRRLTKTVEWEIDPQTGVVQLLQLTLQPLEQLVLFYTKLKPLKPFVVNGTPLLPRFFAKFLSNVSPNETNGFLGARLTATYTFENPDSFYARSTSLKGAASDVVDQIVATFEAAQTGNGPRTFSRKSPDNWTQGRISLSSEVQEAHEKDRIARHFLSFYTQLACFWDQISETAYGTPIGDRDGKFRFPPIQASPYPHGGFEDSFTGKYVPRNVGLQSLQVFTSSVNTPLQIDPLVFPQSFDEGRLKGFPLAPSDIQEILNLQKGFIQNDVDDEVLLGASRPVVTTTPTPPFLAINIFGVFSPLYEPSNYSRLFPTRANVFFTLAQGLGADLDNGEAGSYAWRKKLSDGSVRSTFGTQIGRVGNPVLGDIESISQRELRPRLGRAWVVKYLPNGSSVFGLSRPSVVLSQVPINELDLDPQTGEVDPAQFLSQGGTVVDLNTGNAESSLPFWSSGDRLSVGVPSGELFELTYQNGSVFVDAVLQGCVVTFMDVSGDPITTPNSLLLETSNGQQPLNLFTGDTLFVVTPLPEVNLATATLASVGFAASSLPNYRIGLDIDVRSNGRVTDISYPSETDPSLLPLKELLGQNSPAPLSHMEGEVDFGNTSVEPLRFPALDGLPLNDAGDREIPYLKATSEIDYLAQVGSLGGSLLDRDVLLGGYYPDELLFVDGELIDTPEDLGGGFFKEPSVIYTETDQVLPDYGQSPAREGDFLILEVDDDTPEGWQGLWSVGALRETPTGLLVEPARFCTQVSKGSVIQYNLQNYAVYVSGAYTTTPQTTDPAGVRLFGDIANDRLIFSFQDIPFALNDGSNASGNLNDIFSAHNSNVLTIDLLSRPDDLALDDPSGEDEFLNAEKDGRFLVSFLITSNSVEVIPFKGGSLGVFAHTGVQTGVFDAIGGESAPASSADNRHIILTGLGAGALGFLTPLASSSEWYLPHDHLDPLGANDRRISKYGFEFALSVNTLTGESVTAEILSDRLTFRENLDMRLTRPRGFSNTGNPNGAVVYSTSIQVQSVELGEGSMSSCNDFITTLVARDLSLSTQGSWSPSPDGFGVFKVPALDTEQTDVRGSLQCSQTQDKTTLTDILKGEGVAQNHVILPTTVIGNLSSVEKGDVVYVSSSSDLSKTATAKAGTYVVRHAIGEGLDPYIETEESGIAGHAFGFLTSSFPEVVSLDIPARELTLSSTDLLPATGRLFFHIDPTKINDSDPSIWSTSFVAIDYVSVVGSVVTLAAYTQWFYGDGSVIPDPVGDLDESAFQGLLVGWHDASFAQGGVTDTLISIRGGALPDDSSVVGYQGVLGVQEVAFSYSTNTETFALADLVEGVPAQGELGFNQDTVLSLGQYDPTNEIPVYEDVPRSMQTAFASNGLYNPQGHITTLQFPLLPETEISLTFRALSGVWLEPSTPQSSQSVVGNPKVVGASYSLPSSGMREPSLSEDVLFEVRRVRRWHGKQTLVEGSLEFLRGVYEIRRGITSSYDPTTKILGAVFSLNWNLDDPARPQAPNVWNTGKSFEGTNLGGFEEAGVRSGDTVRFLNNNGDVLYTAEVSRVLSSSSLVLVPPSLKDLQAVDVEGLRFEVFLTKAPVPHEQSCTQLLEAITSEIVLSVPAVRTDADPTNWTGGYVDPSDGATAWSEVSNILKEDSGQGFGSVRRGDLVVVDPSGKILNTEQGSRPFGDISVPQRTAKSVTGDSIGSPYQASKPSPFDDNRGFYRVGDTYSDRLVLESSHLFAGDASLDKVFAELDTDLSYSLLPTIHGSTLSPDGVEGQNDLRPTAFPVADTYNQTDAVLNAHSIRPFAFKILRPLSVFSDEFVDTVLFLRERTLSFIELIQNLGGSKGGSYFDWQVGNHYSNLGDLSDPSVGLGLLSNLGLTTVLGEVSVSPYMNSSDCLSLHDRRFFLADSSLTRLEPSGDFHSKVASSGVDFGRVGGPYTSTSERGSQVRPLLSDYIKLCTEQRDRLRAIQATWLLYRTHRLYGTLSTIKALERRLSDQESQDDNNKTLASILGETL